MKASFFDVSLNAPDRGSGRSLDGTILFQGSRTAASVHVYTCPGIRGDEWARVATVRPLDVKWMDPFEFKSGDGRIEGRGIVLLPGSPDPKKMKTAKRRDLLERLAGGEREMILALAREKGVQGLRAPEISDFCRLSPSRIEAHARDLEAEDEIRILSFSPLCLVARIALDFLQDKVIEFLVRFHNSHPERKGAERDAIVARYGPPEIVLSLVVRTLEKDGRLRTDGRLFWLADFRVLLRAEDEEVLRRIERMLDRGELGTASRPSSPFSLSGRRSSKGKMDSSFTHAGSTTSSPRSGIRGRRS